MNVERKTFVILENSSQIISKLEADDKIEIKYGVQEETNDKVVIKCEQIYSKAPRLQYEYRILKMLQSVNVPKLYYFGPFNEKYALVTQCLGEDLDQLLRACDGRFHLKTVLQIAEQAIDRIEYMHSKKLIHRRISPTSFQMGCPGNEDASFIYLTDVGLAKEYWDKLTNDHIPFREQELLIGIPRYMSIAAHEYKEQGRKDDLESLGYVLVYLLKGRLPWQGLEVSTLREHCSMIADLKVNIKPSKLCETLPLQFTEYFEYVRGLDFIQQPNYAYLKNLFTDVFRCEQFERDNLFDWNI